MKRFVLILACLLAPALASAQSQPAAEKKPPSTYDKIWSNLTDWYVNSESPVVQRVIFTGRFQHDFAVVDADQGDHNESNVRRVRFGPRVTFMKNYLFHAELEVNPQEHNPFYVRFT